MSENSGEWPQVPRSPQHSRGFQDPGIPQNPGIPRSSQNPRAPQRPQGSRRQPDEGVWRPDEYRRPLPPAHEPVYHEPGYGEPGYGEPGYGEPGPVRSPEQGYPDDSPRHRTPRPSGPEAGQWHPGQPAQASYDQEEHRPQDPYGVRGRHEEQGHYTEQGHYAEQGKYAEQGGYAEHPGKYEDGYEADDRFVPGFGDDDDDSDTGYGDSDYGDTGHGYGGHRGRRAARQDGRGGGRRPRRRFRWIAPLAALLIIVVPLAVGGFYAYSFYMSKYHPADYSGNGTGSVVVRVPSGASPTSLGPELVKLGVVASSRAFVLAAEHNPNPAGLLPGFYGMHKHMQASVAYALLINPKNMVQIAVTIPEGWRVSQTVAWLGVKSGIPASAYQAALKDPASLGLPSYANGEAEGYLFPDTYQVQPHETALTVLKGMVQSFNQEAALVNLPAAARQVHLTQGQVITMASLVQAEGGRLTDYPKIARVIYNRLAQGIPLQLDSTVLYGLNTYGIMATYQQLNSPSPYNTYRHKGLPPGPIDSPGNAAIQAVLHPAAGNWVYFVTVDPKTGETLFTSSPAQFQQFREELQRNLSQGR
jgi:uncharacterized YceG family protein